MESKRKKRQNPAKRWCFTLNNYTQLEAITIEQLLCTEEVQYAIVGEEIGENGTPHLQGFFNLKKKKRLTSLKAWLNDRAHYEEAKGSDEQNRRYCSKSGNILISFGSPQKQGQRNDLVLAAELLKESGGNMAAVADLYPSAVIRYGRGLQQYWQLIGFSARDFKTEVFVYVGPPGCGKSRAAAELGAASGGKVYYKPRGEWWDGYNGEATVIIDDFYGWLKYDELLRLCDRYPHRVPVKGGFVQFCSKRIILTSNIHVWMWYRFESYDASALMRRINVYKLWNGSVCTFDDLCDEKYNFLTPLKYNY
ncbi:replication-association protein [Human stool-associated circular virus NG13]|uniref:Replication-associated protein n=1 Tax=Human stool-associated circular virus NG13 TaxID=743300 RepID=D4N3R0_9CIRC|nr:replication-association protein [Human stool-associated circular virus NG13]ADD62475.1 replication-association protein [Human stool-associated circular virus NG13]